MKSENSKLLVGLGLGALVGVTVGYLMSGDHRKKLESNLNEMGHGIKDGVKSVFSKVKSKAEHVGAQVAGKANDWSEKAANKADEWAEEAGNKTNAIRQEMENRSKTDAEAHEKYTQNFKQDLNDIKDKMKGRKEETTLNSTAKATV